MSRIWSCLSRRRVSRFFAGLGIFILLIAADYVLYPYFAQPTAPAMNLGENGLWLRYTWYFGEHTKADISRLATHLQSQQISYAYFHVRSVIRDGSLHYRYPTQARTLTSQLHMKAPKVKILAWIYAGNAIGNSTSVNLSDKAVRHKMVDEAVWLTTRCGFDGIQWDYEICNDGDPGFLALMRETRAALPEGKLLSTATPIYAIVPIRRLGWSESYFAEVAGTCDQLCVMVYDTAMVLPRAYVIMMRNQIRLVTRSVAKGNPNCRVLIGLPTYDNHTPSHNPAAENLALALKGVCEGLADHRTELSVFAGVAIFADYTTDNTEWQIYRDWWLDRR
ncbi:MAG: glycosyl hydrolase family 18 protein [Armatimonadota bacterium]